MNIMLVRCCARTSCVHLVYYIPVEGGNEKLQRLLLEVVDDVRCVH
jgi:hypothetical protein